MFNICDFHVVSMLHEYTSRSQLIVSIISSINMSNHWFQWSRYEIIDILFVHINKRKNLKSWIRFFIHSFRGRKTCTMLPSLIFCWKLWWWRSSTWTVVIKIHSWSQMNRTTYRSCSADHWSRSPTHLSSHRRAEVLLGESFSLFYYSTQLIHRLKPRCHTSTVL